MDYHGLECKMQIYKFFRKIKQGNLFKVYSKEFLDPDTKRTLEKKKIKINWTSSKFEIWKTLLRGKKHKLQTGKKYLLTSYLTKDQ